MILTSIILSLYYYRYCDLNICSIHTKYYQNATVEALHKLNQLQKVCIVTFEQHLLKLNVMTHFGCGNKKKNNHNNSKHNKHFETPLVVSGPSDSYTLEEGVGAVPTPLTSFSFTMSLMQHLGYLHCILNIKSIDFFF